MSRISALGFLLLPAVAVAAAPPRGKATVEVKPIEPRLTRPAAPPAEVGKDQGPSVSLERFLRDRAAKRKEITAAQIAKMKALVAITQDDDPQKPDFLFRLAELYAENQRFYFDRAHELDQKIFEAPPAQKPVLERERRGHEAREQAWLLESVKAYVAATRFPKYERMDEVLFRLAYLLASVKKEDDARGFLLRLIKDYPASRYIPDAYLAFAELYFDKGEMGAALRFYEKVAEFPASGVYPYAVYKKGWCHVNLGDFKTALETFVGVARMTKERRPAKVGAGAGAGADPRQLEVLAKEARKDIVTAYARVGGPDKAWEFFRRTGGDGAGKMMEMLAERYWEQGQAPDSTRVYRKIIAESMTSPRICEWQGKVLRNTLSSGAKRDQTQELERLGAVYERTAAPRAPQAAPKDLALECRNAFHDAARELALVWHREAQRTRNLDTYRLAERAYRLFLAHFPADPEAYEMSYYLGELLWVLERWQDAAEQYTRVVEMSPGGKYLRDAAYAAVLAWKNALAVADDAHREEAGRGHEAFQARERQGKLGPLPIPENQQKMIAAFHTYRAHVPDAPELPVMIYREAYIDYDYNHFAEAEKLFQEIVDKHAGHELGIYAANLLLDTLNAQGKRQEVVAWTRKLLETPPFNADRPFVITLTSIMSDAYDLEGRDFEKKGEPKECGRSFLAAAEALPEHPKHAERLWNAAQCFQNAHLVGRAVSTWQALIKEHPADTLAKRALFRVGAGYHQLAFYSEAARYYEDFAKKYPGEPQAASALGSATAFREGLGDGAAAIADMDAFVGFYGPRKPEAAAGAYFQIGEVYEKEGRTDELRAHLRRYLDRWGRQGGRDREVLAHFRLGQLAWKASCARASEDGACVQIERLSSTRSQQLIAAANRRLGRGKRNQCGPATRPKITVGVRSGHEVAAAGDDLRTAIQLWKAGEAGNPVAGRDAEARRAAAAYAAAGAAFYLAEQDYESLLRIQFPQGLDFSRPAPRDNPRRRAAVAKKLADSNRRFSAYLAEKTRLLEAARARYLEVFRMRQAEWTIAAAARIAQLHQDFAGQLYTAEIPKDLPDTDQWGNHPRDLYCDALEEQAGRIEAQAIDAFKSCLAAATRESWYGPWSRLCERELNQLEPVQFPLASEIKPEPDNVPFTISAAPVMTTLKD
jgi:TolA-binding protein